MRGSLSGYFLLYVLAEAVALVWFWSAFGAFATACLLLAGFLIGLLVMRIAGLKAFQALTDGQQRAAAFGVTSADGSPEVVQGPARRVDLQRTTTDLGKSGLLFVAGLLIAAPGIISDLAGLIMLLPQVRARLARRIGRGIGTHAGPTITVVTADDSGWTAQEWTPNTDPKNADSNPTVIRGEILPPPDHEV